MTKYLLLFISLFFLDQGLFAQCVPQLLNCNAAVQSCDQSDNDPQYWNDQLWWDSNLQTHNLAETKIDLNLSVKHPCPGESLTVRCLIFMDLDGDGVQETVVDSDNPPGAGMVNFNNINTPNYSGGTPRVFDQRLVPGNQKWRFSINTSVVSDTTTYSFQWVSDAAPTIFELPQLAYGKHAVRWIVTSTTGQTISCDKPFVVKDCKSPTVVCLNGLSVNIMPTQMIQLWATDFLQYAEDNVTPAGQIKLGIRKLGTGTGFPVDANGNPVTSVIFTCSELGTQGVELWAIDVEGNADFCETYVIVQDNLGQCEIGSTLIEACATDACAIGLEDAFFEFSFGVGPPFSYWVAGSCGSFNHSLPGNTEVKITPSNDDNPLNGVTTYDMKLIEKHINGIDLFDTPYQWIAADANKDQVIDTFDIIECKKLILGIYNELPNNTSWRFVDKQYVFPSPDPLSAPFPESVTVNSDNLPLFPIEFVGVKICDLTCGNLVGFYDLEPENQHLIGIPEPNPTNEGAMLPLQLLDTESVLLEVLDISGRLVYRAETSLPAGPVLLEIPAAGLMQAGVYVWRIRAGEVVKAGKIVRY